MDSSSTSKNNNIDADSYGLCTNNMIMNMKRGTPPSIDKGDKETLDSTLPYINVSGNNQDKKRSRNDYDINNRPDDLHSRYQHPSSTSRSGDFHGPVSGCTGPMNPNARSGPPQMVGDRRVPPQISPCRSNNFAPCSGGGGGRTYWNSNNNGKHCDDFRGSQPPPCDDFRGNGGGPPPPYVDAKSYASRGADGGGAARAAPLPAQKDQFGRQIPNNRSTSNGGGGMPINQPFSRGDWHVAKYQEMGSRLLNRTNFDDKVSSYGRQMPSFDRHQDGSSCSGGGGGSSIISSSRESEFGKTGIIMQQSKLRDIDLNNVQNCSSTKPGKIENDNSKEREKEIKKFDPTGLKKSSKVAVYKQGQHRASTPTPQEVVVDVVPLSPPTAPPSALALAMARLTDLTAQMEFQYAKHLQLSREHEIIKIKLSVLQGLPVGTDAFRDDLQKLTAEKEEENLRNRITNAKLIAKNP